jgi:hypothetical protein
VQKVNESRKIDLFKRTNVILFVMIISFNSI